MHLIKFVRIYKLGAINRSLKNDKIMYFPNLKNTSFNLENYLICLFFWCRLSLRSWFLCLRRPNFMLIGHVLFGIPLHLNMSITLTMIYKVDPIYVHTWSINDIIKKFAKERSSPYLCIGETVVLYYATTFLIWLCCCCWFTFMKGYIC
jgi:hypothetical protein